MSAPLLQVTGLGKRFGGFVALSGIDLSIQGGERLGLIGPNGSGKSTFVNCLGGAFARYASTRTTAGGPDHPSKAQRGVRSKRRG